MKKGLKSQFIYLGCAKKKEIMKVNFIFLTKSSSSWIEFLHEVLNSNVSTVLIYPKNTYLNYDKHIKSDTYYTYKFK